MIRVRTSDGMHKIKIPNDLITLKELKEAIYTQTNIPVELQVLSRDIAGQQLIGPENLSLQSLNIGLADIIYLAGRLEKKIIPKSYVNKDGEVVSAGVQFMSTHDPLPAQGETSTVNENRPVSVNKNNPTSSSANVDGKPVCQTSNVVDLSNDEEFQSSIHSSTPRHSKGQLDLKFDKQACHHSFSSAQENPKVAPFPNDDDYVRPADPVKSMRLFDVDEPMPALHEPYQNPILATAYPPEANDPISDIDGEALLAAKMAGLSDDDVYLAQFLSHSDSNTADIRSQEMKKRSHSKTIMPSSSHQSSLTQHTASSKAREDTGMRRGPMRALLEPVSAPVVEASPVTKRPTPSRTETNEEDLDLSALGLSAEEIAEQIRMLDMYEDRQLPTDQYKEFIAGESVQAKSFLSEDASKVNSPFDFQLAEDSLDDLLTTGADAGRFYDSDLSSQVDPDVALAISRSYDDRKKEYSTTQRSISQSSASTGIPIRRGPSSTTLKKTQASPYYPTQNVSRPIARFQPTADTVGSNSVKRVAFASKPKTNMESDSDRYRSRDEIRRRKKQEKERAETLLREKQMKEDEELARRLQRDSNDGIYVAPVDSAHDRDIDDMVDAIAGLDQDSFVQSRPHIDISRHQPDPYEDEDWMLAKALNDSMMHR